MNAEQYMHIALKQAQKAFLKDEVPVGAVIVENKTGKIISRAYNQTEHSLDPTAHAEILAIRKACKKLKSKRLWGCSLFVTLEPCTMCASAISHARIENLFIGALDEKGGAVINSIRFFESRICHFTPRIETEILEKESSEMLKSFFKNKRTS